MRENHNKGLCNCETQILPKKKKKKRVKRFLLVPGLNSFRLHKIIPTRIPKDAVHTPKLRGLKNFCGEPRCVHHFNSQCFPTNFLILTCHGITAVKHPDKTMCSRISNSVVHFYDLEPSHDWNPNCSPGVYTPLNTSPTHWVCPRWHCLNPTRKPRNSFTF